MAYGGVMTKSNPATGYGKRGIAINTHEVHGLYHGKWETFSSHRSLAAAERKARWFRGRGKGAETEVRIVAL